VTIQVRSPPFPEETGVPLSIDKSSVINVGFAVPASEEFFYLPQPASVTDARADVVIRFHMGPDGILRFSRLDQDCFSMFVTGRQNVFLNYFAVIRRLQISGLSRFQYSPPC
jgi:hypothetical protein